MGNNNSKIKNHYDCSLILCHDLIGGKWKQRILWHILKGDNRFSLLKKGIPDITQKVLFSQLRELENSGILTRTVIKNEPPKEVYYSINVQYSSLIPIIESLCEFSKDYAEKNGIVIDD
ncbi:MAG: helix-turn-helix transcriptional regulator [Clostridiales bacterium]|nr:helix-turn-helix transcriptional regulator [Clostridiales bacterium]